MKRFPMMSQALVISLFLFFIEAKKFLVKTEGKQCRPYCLSIETWQDLTILERITRWGQDKITSTIVSTGGHGIRD